MTKALLFPGQGSQAVGMGKSLFDAFREARDVFEEVDDALNQPLSSIMFEGPMETLTLTENAQPAIMAASIAALRVLQAECGFRVEDAAYAAGHSLGEYSALAATGALSLSDAARLLKLRGQAMQRSVPQGKGAMAALLGVDYAVAEEIAKLAAADEVCSVANDNASGQVVISGAKAAVDRALEIAKEKGAKRSVLLQVSAPFHCPLMAPAAGAMSEALAVVRMQTPCIPIVTNMTAAAETDPETLKRLLVDQVTGMVRWRESMEYLAKQGVNEAVEIGTGKVLSGLMKRIAPHLEMMAVGTLEDVAALIPQAA
jgi:[acyl-carrier-protein] S-malonyltransferase